MISLFHQSFLQTFLTTLIQRDIHVDSIVQLAKSMTSGIVFLYILFVISWGTNGNYSHLETIPLPSINNFPLGVIDITPCLIYMYPDPLLHLHITLFGAVCIFSIDNKASHTKQKRPKYWSLWYANSLLLSRRNIIVNLHHFLQMCLIVLKPLKRCPS